ncbi:hypothetical protein VB796_20470 [Arcicella sp. LKC2W]|uniref:hypothetical protein n=1 Tax=Arcicella sp. LKC2W TaxID=2984198 RepID=UPI002B1FA9DF|nr:hypothetical protein [Arcicella sp. LKC2W]MEA5461452.1 hypothetical protein [Arcicella sp. LKC2W]
MKKLLTFSFLLALLLTASSKSFSQAYKQGDNLLNGTIGIGNGFGNLAIGGSFEHGFTETISAGGSFDYLGLGSVYGSGGLLYIAARGSFHAGELLKASDKLDPYAGLGLGYVSWPGTAFSGYGASGLFFGGHVGARYWFADNLGGVAELGFGTANLKLGVTLKF